MSIFHTAYDTAAGSGVRLGETIDRLKTGTITNSFERTSVVLSRAEDPLVLCQIQGGNTGADTVPYFSHPLILKSNKGVMETYIDVRNYGKYEVAQQRFHISNRPEYQWNYLRAVLNYLWMGDRPDMLREVGDLPVAVYSTFISEIVTRKYALDPGQQLILAVVAAYFYYSLFTDDLEFDTTQHQKIGGKIAKVTRIPADKVFEIMDGLKPIHGIEKFCQVAAEKTDAVRLKDFNVGVLFAIAASNWYGSNARENVMVGLEHIPTWLMMCYASITDATFRRSTIAKLVERYSKGDLGVLFVRSLDVTMDMKKLFADKAF